MASTYSNLGIELIGTGEQAGTWGVTTNSNFSNILDNAIVGYKAVAVTGTSSGSPTVLTVSDGSASDGQKRIIEATGSPASAGFLQISPNDFAGYYFVRNSTTQTLNVFQGTYSAGNAVTIETGYDAIIRCNGGGAGAVVSFINYNLKTGNISANGTVTATALSGPHNGTVGATTPSTGAFTTLAASSTVSGTGFSTYLASPPAIGGTAAAAGSFTTLAASSTVSGTGFSTYLASPPAIGGTTASTVRGTTITATTAFSGPLNGTVGATTPSTGAFTTLSASSTVSGTGFSTYLASPPAIGGTTAAAGSFTSLSASGTVSGSSGSFGNLASSGTVSGTGFSTYLASPPAIGGTAAAAGSFTTLNANGNVAITGASRRILSDFSTAGSAGTVFQTSTVNGTTNVMAAPNGTGAYSNFVAYSSSDIANSGFLQMYHTAGNGWISTSANGTGTGGYVAISPSGGGSSTRAYFTTTGLGIGTTTPSVSFETVGSSIFGDSIASDTARFNSCVGIGRAPSLSYAMYIQGVNTTSSDFALRLDNTAEALFYVRNDGLITTGAAALSPVNNTTANAANLYTSASGVLFKSTSSLRYKNSIENAKYGIAEVMQIRPVTYKGNNDGDKIFGGFIAEEIDAIEKLHPFVVYDDQNRPDALAYGPMVSLLTKAIQEQQVMIEDLKARIAVLEAK